jgi:transglutaminase-like putative cysteine protease
MRQASWEELFRAGEEKPVKPSVWSRLADIFSWEDIVTLVIVLAGFLTVVQSINGADWVPEMPSLFGVAFLGLAIGLVLARAPLNEGVAHLIAILAGVVGVFFSSTSQLQGSTSDRASELIDRFKLWGEAIFSGGISNDNLPFVVLVVSLTYLTAYLSAWAIFRWYNAWVGLVPGGLALLTNISYLPGQRSAPLLIYLFCAFLLVARVNLLRQAREWRKQHTRYPDLISLHVLNVTVWMGLALLLLAWILPVGHGSSAFYSLWRGVTAPIVDPASDLGRVFSAIDSKKGGTVHKFGSTLPLQGEISLGGGEVMQVTATEAGLLRAQTYDFYTAQGWRLGANSQITTSAWPALKAFQSPEEARRQLRRPVTVQVTTSKKANVMVSAGQPLAVSVDSRVVFGPDPSDVTSIRPSKPLNEDSQYRVDGTVSNASAGRLRGAGTSYPAWLTAYTQLSPDLPQTVVQKARDLTKGFDNSYDKANAVEAYLRTFAVDTKIKPAPPKRDSVAYFLFDAQRGYFDYHASAMVVLLRSLGVPSRLAVGYIIRPQDRVPDTNVYLVAEANSFAWPEVYFPGLGWVEFNPTPSEPRISRTGSDDLGFSEGGTEEFFEEPPAEATDTPPVGPATDAIDELQIDEGSNLVSRIIFTVILLFLGITVVGGSVFQYSWQHGLRGLDYPVQIWEKTMRLSKWARIRTLPQDTPREVVVRLKRELPDVDDLDYLGESFIRSQYGQKELKPDEKERLAQVWNKARNNLLARLLRWK